MINWWVLFHNSLWVAGAALLLGALSLANYEAQRSEVRLWQQLQGPGFQVWFAWGMALVCLGLLFSSELWWQYAIWSLLSAAFIGYWLWLWNKRRAARLESKDEMDPAAKAATPRSRKVRWLGWGLLLAGLLVLGAWAVTTGAQLFQHVQSLRFHLDRVEDMAQSGFETLEPGDLEEAGQHLGVMRQDLESLQSLVGPFLPLGRLVFWLPEHGGDLAASSDLLQVATGAAVAGDETFRALAPALLLMGESQAVTDAGRPLGRRLLPSLVTAQPQLEVARQELDRVSDARGRIPAGGLSPEVEGILGRVDRYLPWFETVVDGALLAPSLMGADGRRTYLVLAQNNHELRPTGGFISGVGVLAVEDGWLSSLDFVDSYSVDSLEAPHELAPAAFQQTLAGDLLFFRDANWDADFPTSARRALEIYARDQALLADGVIALDITALEQLIDAMGSINVGVDETPVTGKSLQLLLQEQWANPSSVPGYEGARDSQWWLHRKDFMGEIAAAAANHLAQGETVDMIRLAQATKQVLAEKHMLLYLGEPEAGHLLRERNWDGALPDSAHRQDFLMVVDANVGFNKVDPNVARSIDYRVTLDTVDNPRTQLTLSYRNDSRRPAGACVQEARYGDDYADMMDRCYWNYVRVYVPKGSKLLAGPDLQLPGGSLLAQSSTEDLSPTVSQAFTEGDWTVWAAFFDLEPGEARTLTFEYELPERVQEQGTDGLTRYRLKVQKQPGTLAVPLRMTVTLPAGADLLSAEPSGLFAHEVGLLTAETDLRTDREFSITYDGEAAIP